MTKRPLHIVIFGGSAYLPADPVHQAAEALGRAIAQAGWTVVNGGYGGTMEASARGARQAGGSVVGVTCSIFQSAPNAWLTEIVPTADLHERLRRLVELGDAYIALPGSTGTLAELAMVWELINKRLLPLRPVLCWGAFWRPVVSVFDHQPTQDPHVPALGNRPEQRGALITFVDTPDAAIAAIRQFQQTHDA